MKKFDIGIIGLGKVGQNLALNFSDKNFKVLVYDNEASKTQEFLKNYNRDNLQGEHSLKLFIESLKKPAIIILRLSTIDPIDITISVLTKFLKKGDLIVDAGNSYYLDTIDRKYKLDKYKIGFLGLCVGGMQNDMFSKPIFIGGGDYKLWKKLEPVLKKIVAKDYNNKKCITYLGQIGVAHYVNGIQNILECPMLHILAESYHGLKLIYGLDSKRIGEVFFNINEGKIGSNLLTSAIKILQEDNDIHQIFLEQINDVAGYNKSGILILIDALKRGIPTPSLMQAINARFVSQYKKTRLKLAKFKQINNFGKNISKKEFLNLLESGINLGIISCYVQGFDLIKRTSKQEGWHVNLAGLARVWQGSSTIQVKSLDLLYKSFKEYGKNKYILEMSLINDIVQKDLQKFLKLIIIFQSNGVNCSVMTASYNYLNMMFEKNSNANFVQCMRNYFGGYCTNMKNI